MDKTAKSILVKQLALDYGFEHIGIAKAAFMDEEARRLTDWLAQGKHGKMSYMERHFDLRVDPTKLVPGAKSVISLSFNYHTTLNQKDSEAPKIASYAYGRDYHKVLKKKLKQMLANLQEKLGNFNARIFVDSAPVLERDWAKRAGVGWVGKHTLLLNPKHGSYFFLAEIICDLDLDVDHPIKDHCGTCTRCIDACPTDAISPEGYVLDGSKCISYATIELKEAIPSYFQDKMENWMFGCDICQQVCPWNRFAKQHNEADFEPKQQTMEMSKQAWEEITEEVFFELFKGTPIMRTKYEGLRRNIEFLKKEKG